MRSPKLAAVALVLALLAPSVALAQEQGGTVAGMTFDWPAPGRVRVITTTEKRGQTGKTRYDLVIREAPEGDGKLIVSFEDFEMLEANGIDMTTPEGKKLLGPTAALGAAIPDFVVSAEGEVIDFVGYEEMLDRTLETFKAMAMMRGDFNEEEHARVAAAMRSPQTIAMLKRKSADMWSVWVGAWVGLDLAAGEVDEGESEVPMPDGTTIAVPLKVTHDGTAPDAPGHVRLRLETLLEGERAIAAMRAAMKGLGGPGAGDVPPIKEFRRATKVTVVTDPKTLRPLKASSEATVVMDIEGEGRQSQRESQVYEFSWSIGKGD